jgi:hypothetical protein
MENRLAEDPDDYYAKRYFEKKKGAKVRRCTYCNLKGHNRATCPELTRDVSAWKARNSTWRIALVEEMIADGMGVGALIKHASIPYGIEHTRQLVMIAGINPETHVGHPYTALVIRGIINPMQQRETRMPSSTVGKAYKKVDGIGSGDCYGASVTVMSPTRHSLLRTIPNYEEWLQGGSVKWIKKEIFGEKQSPDFYHNKYEN